MASEAELALILSAIDKGFESTVKKANEETKGLGKGLSEVAKIAGGFVVGAGIQKLGGFLVDAAKGAAEDAASRERLNQAIENTGMSSQNASRWVDGLIKSGQDLGFTDDQTRDSLSLLTAQTGDAIEASKRYKIAQDLARGANIDVVTASKLLGKVTDENVNVLSRYGIAAKKGMTETELFGLVQQKFGGQAEAFADSTAGKMARLSDRMGELKETIGAAVLPVMTALADVALHGVVPAIEAVANVIGPIMSKAFGAVAPTLAKVRAGITGFARALRGGAGTVDSFGNKAAALSSPIGKLAELIRTVVPQALAFLRTKFAELQAYFESDIKPALENVATAFAAVATFIIDNWQKLMPVIKPILDQIVLAIQTAVGIISNVLAIFIDLLQGDWSGAWKNFQELIGVVWDYIVGTIGNAIELLKGIIGLGWEAVKAMTGLAWDGIKALIGLAWDGIKEGVKLGLQALWDYMNTTFLELPSLVVELGVRLAEAGLEAGKKLADGIIDGIGDLASRVADKVSIAGVSLNDVGNFGKSLIPGRALGGPASGLTWVGENGPELLDLPGGSHVYSNSQSQAITSGGGVNVYIQGPVYARDEAEARRVGGDIGWAISMRRRGVPV